MTSGTLSDPRTISTLGGGGSQGFVEGPATLATFSDPRGIVHTSDGSKLLIADNGNNRIRLLMEIVCGQGRTEGTEGCDDGNGQDSDGCSSSCSVEHGYYCENTCLDFCSNGPPSRCSTKCGDGVQVGEEACDDGNQADRDGCSSRCSVETGWVCSPLPASSPPAALARSAVSLGSMRSSLEWAMHGRGSGTVAGTIDGGPLADHELEAGSQQGGKGSGRGQGARRRGSARQGQGQRKVRLCALGAWQAMPCPSRRDFACFNFARAYLQCIKYAHGELET